jgi:catalase
VTEGLGLAAVPPAAPAAVAPKTTIVPSPALSLVAKAKPTLTGRKVGVLVTDGSDGALVDRLKKGVEGEGAQMFVVAPKAGGVALDSGKHLAADFAVTSGPSVFFDAVVVAPSAAGAASLARESAAVDFVRDAFGHLKVIGYAEAAAPLFAKAGIPTGAKDPGLIAVDGAKGEAAFIAHAKEGRVWAREPEVRTVH